MCPDRGRHISVANSRYSSGDMDAHLGNLLAFAHLVRAGSVSDAAAQLGVSQSAVTQRLQKLESAVGSKLYMRERGRMTLTPAGQDILHVAERQAELSLLINEMFQGYTTADEGALRIIADAPLPALDLIGAFARARPRVRLDFTLYDRATSIDLLRESKVDVALMTALEPSPQWSARTIATTRHVAYLRADHPLARQNTVSISDFASETFLLTEAGSLTERVVGRALADANVTPACIMQLATFPLVKEAILHGVGVAVFLDNASTDVEGLVRRPVEELDQTFTVSIATPNGRETQRLVRAFMQHAEENDGVWQTSSDERD